MGQVHQGPSVPPLPLRLLPASCQTSLIPLPHPPPPNGVRTVAAAACVGRGLSVHSAPAAGIFYGIPKPWREEGHFSAELPPGEREGKKKKRGMGEMKSLFPPSQIGTGLQMKMLHLEGCDKMEKTALEASEAASLSYLLCPCPREMVFSTDGANPERGTKAVFKIRSLRTLAHVLKCLISRLQHFPFLFLCFFKKRNP